LALLWLASLLRGQSLLWCCGVKRRAKMQIDLIRELGTEGYTIGTMRINNAYECYTLEDQVRPEKIYGETAIPEGTYKVIVSYSPRFKRDLPLLLNVPNFEGIRIHPGNKADDTHGCILVGVSKGHGSIGGSRIAFNLLYERILQAWSSHEDIQITITGVQK
jgi:hypothetical protein